MTIIEKVQDKITKKYGALEHASASVTSQFGLRQNSKN